MVFFVTVLFKRSIILVAILVVISINLVSSRNHTPTFGGGARRNFNVMSRSLDEMVRSFVENGKTAAGELKQTLSASRALLNTLISSSHTKRGGFRNELVVNAAANVPTAAATNK